MMVFHGYKNRPIVKQDLPVLLEWRNSDRIRSEMLTDHLISWEEHLRWYEKISSATLPLHFVLEFDGHPVGYVGFSDLDEVNGRCSVSSYLGDVHRAPVDAGIVLDCLGIDHIFSVTVYNKIWSYVFKDNVRACRVNDFIGYTQEGVLRQHFRKDGRYVDVCIFSMLREEWPTKKKKIQELMGV